jgi:CRP-like cAMP-binding protein
MKLDPNAFVANPELIQALDKRSTAIECEDGCVLFRQGEIPQGLYIVKQGETTLTMASPKGDEVMRIAACAGSLLGLPGLIGNEPYTLTATARTGTSLSFVSREEFTSLMQSDPHLSLMILEVLAAEVRTARQALSRR